MVKTNISQQVVGPMYISKLFKDSLKKSVFYTHQKLQTINPDTWSYVFPKQKENNDENKWDLFALLGKQ